MAVFCNVCTKNCLVSAVPCNSPCECVPPGEPMAANRGTGTQAVAVRADKCGPNVPASAAHMPMLIYKGGLFFM